MKQRYIGVLAIALALLMVTAPAATASNSVVNYDSDVAPLPWVSEDITIEAHDMSASSPLAYEADDGSDAMINGRINESVDNPVSYTPTDVEFDAATSAALADVADVVESGGDGETIQAEIYEAADRHDIEIADLFAAGYQLFFDLEEGPKLGPFLAKLDRSFVVDRLRQER